MKRKINRKVAEAWSDSLEARNHRYSYWTDGKVLVSYNLEIGDTCLETGTKVLRDYTAKGRHGFRSQTTSCHVGLARLYADLVD